MQPCFVRSAGRWSTQLIAAAAALVVPVASAHAQVVTPKTLPVHQGEQFSIYPSVRAGMANVAIALDDSLLDPFSNPSRASRTGNSLVFGLPYMHSIDDDRGGGKTIPVGTIWSSGRWAGTAVFALQQLDRAGPARWAPLSERTAVNQYFSASIARRLPGDLSVGASAYWAGLGAIDGVDLLYAGSDTIRQDGSLADFRVGLTKSWEGGRVLDLVATHNRTDMSHDVHFTTWRWDTIARVPVVTRRYEHNVDRTNIWSAHGRLHRPIGDKGWRMGWLGTYSHLSHPKIPNYEIMNVPRDPGTTHAFNAGIGVSHSEGPATFGVDVILEPMTSRTWADAERDTAKVGGGVIPKGAKTVENDFRFSNAIMRMGFGRAAERPDSGVTVGYQLGVGVHAIRYRLHQINNVLGTDRRQNEHWMEWSPTLALRFRTRAYEIEYGFRMVCGPASCFENRQEDRFWLGVGGGAIPDGGGIIAAPSRPIDFDGGTSVSHRFVIVVPIG